MPGWFVVTSPAIFLRSADYSLSVKFRIWLDKKPISILQVKRYNYDERVNRLTCVIRTPDQLNELINQIVIWEKLHELSLQLEDARPRIGRRVHVSRGNGGNVNPRFGGACTGELFRRTNLERQQRQLYRRRTRYLHEHRIQVYSGQYIQFRMGSAGGAGAVLGRRRMYDHHKLVKQLLIK